MNTQVCHFFRPFMEHQDEEKGGGIKRKLEESKYGIDLERLGSPIPFFNLPEDVVFIILSELDRKTLGIFEKVFCKAALLQSEKVWKSWRERDFLNFSWDSIPCDLANHHKWSYLLNEAIVTSLDEIGVNGLIDKVHLDVIVVYENYKHIVKRFHEFFCFFNVVLCKRKFSDDSFEKIIIQVANEKKSGGELALKALISEVDNDEESPEDTIHYFLEAIEKNATFLAKHWMNRENFYLDCGGFSVENLLKYQNKNSQVFRNTFDNEHELIAIKAAEKKDFRATVKLLSLQTGWHMSSLIFEGVKLPSAVWLDSARQNNQYHQDILLLYAKAFETYPLENVPNLLWEEAADKIFKKKCIEENGEDPLLEQYLNGGTSDNLEFFWINEATDDLRSIKKTLESKILIKQALFLKM